MFMMEVSGAQKHGTSHNLVAETTKVDKDSDSAGHTGEGGNASVYSQEIDFSPNC